MDLVVKMKFGAHLYGLADAGSDLDYKGVFMPSRQEILLGRIPKSRHFTTGDHLTKNSPGDMDVEIYSLHHFIDLACQCQIVAMDMLHAPDAFLEVSSVPWTALVKQRHRFYTKDLRVFAEYARRQTAKYGIKGSRLDAVAKVLTLLRRQRPDARLTTVWNDLPREEHCSELPPAPNGILQYQVCGKILQASVRIGQVISILEKFYDAYGERAKRAAENRDIDWKAVSHAVRAAVQTREILTIGTIRYPLKEAPLLKQIKAGQLDFTTEAAPLLASLIDEVEAMIDTCDLPAHADRDYWDDFLCDTLERHRFHK